MCTAACTVSTFIYTEGIVLDLDIMYKRAEGEKLKMWLDSLLQNEIENSVSSEEEDDKCTTEDFQITRYSLANLDLEVRISLEEETVWLTQEEIASLFDVTQQNISLHINNIIEMGELDFEGIHKYYLYMGRTGRQYKMSLYNLDLILAVGYRVNSVRAIEFRRWASSVLKQYLFKGDVNKIDTTSNWEGFKYIFSNLKKVEERLSKVEEKVNKNEIPNEILADSINYYAIYNGLISIIATANKSVMVIDPYADKDVLSIFSKIGEEINKFIVYGDYSKIDENMITTFKNEFNNSYFAKSDLFHDRFIIIDEKDVYQMGSSINYLGKKISLINRVETPKIVELIINTTKELFKL